MKKQLWVIFIALAQIMLVLSHSEAGTTSSQSFKLIVVIPAVIGLNVPDPEAVFNKDQNQTAPISENDVTSNVPVEIVLSDRFEDGQAIRYQTIVVR